MKHHATKHHLDLRSGLWIRAGEPFEQTLKPGHARAEVSHLVLDSSAKVCNLVVSAGAQV